jgi:hypothetical protein
MVNNWVEPPTITCSRDTSINSGFASGVDVSSRANPTINKNTSFLSLILSQWLSAGYSAQRLKQLHTKQSLACNCFPLSPQLPPLRRTFTFRITFTVFLRHVAAATPARTTHTYLLRTTTTGQQIFFGGLGRALAGDPKEAHYVRYVG